jgi:hypothetical protein
MVVMVVVAMMEVVVVVMVVMVVMMIRRPRDDFAFFPIQGQILNRHRIARKSNRKAQVHHGNRGEQEFRVHLSFFSVLQLCVRRVSRQENHSLALEALRAFTFSP